MAAVDQAAYSSSLRISRRYLQVMRSDAPALLPVFRSRLQADILAALLLHPDREYSLTDLARQFGAPLSTVHGEVKRLTEAGLLSRREAGRSAMVRANISNRLVAPLAEVLLLTWGPRQVVADEFAGLSGAERVVIFGSWADRYLQHPGQPPHDLDVLVVGRPDRQDVYDAADRAEQRLGMPVNPVIRAADAWQNATDSLVQQIQPGPFVEVLGPPNPDGDEVGNGQVAAVGTMERWLTAAGDAQVDGRVAIAQAEDQRDAGGRVAQVEPACVGVPDAFGLLAGAQDERPADGRRAVGDRGTLAPGGRDADGDGAGVRSDQDGALLPVSPGARVPHRHCRLHGASVDGYAPEDELSAWAEVRRPDESGRAAGAARARWHADSGCTVGRGGGPETRGVAALAAGAGGQEE